MICDYCFVYYRSRQRRRRQRAPFTHIGWAIWLRAYKSMQPHFGVDAVEVRSNLTEHRQCEHSWRAIFESAIRSKGGNKMRMKNKKKQNKRKAAPHAVKRDNCVLVLHQKYTLPSASTMPANICTTKQHHQRRRSRRRRRHRSNNWIWIYLWGTNQAVWCACTFCLCAAWGSCRLLAHFIQKWSLSECL